MPSSETAPAKVNLFLHVVGRRPDGYHLLDSLAVFPHVGDVLHADPAEELSLALAGPFGGALVAEADNLVLRAARALAAAAGIAPRARLVLEKNLPVASGIGGGSADAAAALRLLGRLWDVAVPDADLHAIALGLGADVPVCLASRAARMGGVGEALAEAPALPGFGMVLVNPGVAVATPAVFRARSGPFSAPAALPAGWADAAALARDLAALSNDLEPPAVALQPVIGTVLDALRAAPGCLLARMSGSGATCFGLFADPPAAEAAASLLRRPGWWCWGGAC
ncbi:4-diphosphocytidyl-2-C-methyl-D-erythritol kinase [Rhodovastum atsumiense]|uniref:4-diphosphocytidyl-2-C-methyl-D-erythritol kinase n=1 Tax=Rhodovastum atsumiense TaxID=504468 RepID=A0A5M6IYY4_9PROT|nr:4-(cytidine 5'-diphospho)-2-C-methyl-D-erythritol kinase [Rhodovastum atsumiense]KAA5613037.1 4-(cytidine 5'-diphospho)-2-C-methyl-D-erythritol kinase [Rhodovastum atsumiense]CAH2600108.1 4-diphosphocytidyl-2-C-methyl-D-erythritol kinase [Rhodovastum atsumiense]